MTQLSPDELAELERLVSGLSDEPPRPPPRRPRALIKRKDPRRAKRARVKAARKRNR